MSFSWTWYFPTGQSWFFCFFTAVLYTTTPIRFLVIDGSRILLVVIFITAITQSSSPRHKKEICTSCFLCACIYCSHGTKSFSLCEGEGDKKRRSTCRWPPCREGSGSLSSQIFRLLLCDLSVFEIWTYHFSSLWLSIWMTSTSPPQVSERFGLFDASSSV